MTAAPQVVGRLDRLGLSVATAESFTSGLVSAALAEVPGASRVLRGGVVAYASDVKAGLLGVDPQLLARGGAVQGEVAAQLATGAARLLGASCGVGTTGVAGPGAADGQPAGTVYLAASHGPQVRVRRLSLAGTRAAVRQAGATAALALLLGLLTDV